MKLVRTVLKVLVPIAVLGGGAALAKWIAGQAKPPVVRPPAALGPLVRVTAVTTTDVRLDVRAQGTVEPLRTVELAAEVSGRVVATHPELRAGGSFTENDVLVEIDPSDYELAITQQEAAVARASLRLVQERAEAEAAVRAWQQLEGDRPADPLVRREPQIHEAELALAAAEALLQKSRLDLARTKVQLPFAGRVRSVHADLGQTVQRGQRLAVVLDTSEVEVRLPIPLAAAEFVALPLAGSVDDGPEVELSAEFAGERRIWPGRIVRTEGEVDRRTRQLTAVARVRAGDAAADRGAVGRPPLLVGMFVAARIVGRAAQSAAVVPTAAVHPGDHVWIVTLRPRGLMGPLPWLEARLERREIEVLRAERDRVVVERGLRGGELVSVTSLETPVDGMRVRVTANEEAR